MEKCAYSQCNQLKTISHWNKHFPLWGYVWDGKKTSKYHIFFSLKIFFRQEDSWYTYVCFLICVCGGMGMHEHCGQNTTWLGWFSPFTLETLGTDCQVWLQAQLSLPSHITGPVHPRFLLGRLQEKVVIIPEAGKK